ncbi:MAG: hypothetical protein JWO80_1625 [Bryobacterales bacterium]|nr:hypothetical protein [Bryobacterales bacterium]
MTARSRISIVTISFNQARYLTDAILSVNCASPDRLQYVIVDPGSTDESRQIIETHRSRFSYVVLEPDLGPADGLNKGFALCDGDVFGYINSDDRFCPGALDFVLDYFDANPEVDVLCGAVRMIDKNGRPDIRNRTPDEIDLRKFAYRACFIWQQATFFRREAFERVGGFNPRNSVHWDSELIVDMVLGGAKVGYVRKLLGDHRHHESTITGSKRFLAMDAKEHPRIQQKIFDAGYPPLSPWHAKAVKLLYKFNFGRHYRYLLGVESLR